MTIHPKVPHSVVLESWAIDRSCKNTAARLGISKSAVSRALKKTGNSQGHGATPVVPYEEILRVYKEEGSYPRTAARLGICKNTVGRAIREKLGQNPGRGKYVGEKVRTVPIDLVIERYQNGELCREIAKDYGVCDELIREVLQDAGIPRRSRGARAGSKNHQYNGGYEAPVHYFRRQSYEVAAICLGHPLPEGVVIHHMDENPMNNSPENLWLFPTARHHSRYHGRLRYCQSANLEVDATLLASENGAVPLPLPNDPIELRPDTSQLFPSDSLELPKKTRAKSPRGKALFPYR